MLRPRATRTVSLVICCFLGCLTAGAVAQNADRQGMRADSEPSIPREAQPTAKEDSDKQRHGPQRPEGVNEKRGLLLHTPAACAGYTLYAPLSSTTTYLVDMKGELVHTWPSEYTPGQAVYLLRDGTLLRCARELHNRSFGGGGIGGRIERLAPDGTVLWEYVLAHETRCMHHDIEPMPNGNVLVIAWEKKSSEEAILAGRDPERLAAGELWPDCILEIQPQGESGGKIVWEWHVWDHLVQEFDPEIPNCNPIAEHPELIDLNYRDVKPGPSRRERRRLRALGYVGGREEDEEADPQRKGPGGPRGPGMGADMCHINAVAYNAKLDQIALSVHEYNEIWIIDHSTTTREAAGHKGGRYGKGGDLLYRWGNPRAYGAGEAKNQQLFAQHDVRWIPEGSPGEGHLLIFNNGGGRPDGRYSSVVEIIPPMDRSGHYRLEPGEAYGPAAPCWEYAASKKKTFFSRSISGAHRLPNGNTLICSGEKGRFFEVTAGGKTVWEYLNPHVEHPGLGHAIAGLLHDTFRGPHRGRGPRHPPRDRRTRDGNDTTDSAHSGQSVPADSHHAESGSRSGDHDNHPKDASSEGDTSHPGESPSRPWGPRRPHPPQRGPGGGWAPPPGGPHGGPRGGSVFRVTRLSADHPGIRRLLRTVKGK